MDGLIEELRAEIERLAARNHELSIKYVTAMNEIERLRAELAFLTDCAPTRKQ